MLLRVANNKSKWYEKEFFKQNIQIKIKPLTD